MSQNPARAKRSTPALAGGRRSIRGVPNREDLLKQLEKTAASMPGMICSFRLRPDGRISLPYASSAINDLYAVAPEDVAEDFGPVLCRMHPADVNRVMASIHESARSMTQWRDEWRFDHPVKGERWIEGCSMPVRESDGSILWHGYVQDITERKDHEQRLAKLNAFLRIITDAVPALISYVDVDLRYRMVNRGYERWFGRAAEETEGRLVREVLGEAVWTAVTPYLERVLAGEAVEYEAELPYKYGGTRWVHVSYLPDRGEDGQVRGFVVMVIDHSERRRIEEELRQSRQQFIDLMARHDNIHESERRHMAHEIHDELGQLLTGMRLAFSAFKLRGDGARKGELGQTVDQLERLLDDATGVVRRISGNLRPVLLEHGLLPALEGLAMDFRNMTRISCRLTVSGEPRQIGDAPTMAAFRIAQESLTNIARHAQAMSVSIHLSYTADHLRMLVQNDGPGFDAAAALKSRASLGLFGMRERAALAGGRMEIVSTPGMKGTRLELELPLGTRTDT